jgi:hypothetical protein
MVLNRSDGSPDTRLGLASTMARVYALSEHEAFRAMTLFLTQYYERAGDDLATLLADIGIEANGQTLDPAACDDWVRCVHAVKATS